MPSNDPSAEQGFRTELPPPRATGPPVRSPLSNSRVVLGWSLQLQLKRNRQQPKVKRKMGAAWREGREGMPPPSEEGKKGEGRQRAALRSKGISNAPSPLQCILLSPTRLKNVAQNNGMECVRVRQRFA